MHRLGATCLNILYNTSLKGWKSWIQLAHNHFCFVKYFKILVKLQIPALNYEFFIELSAPFMLVFFKVNCLEFWQIVLLCAYSLVSIRLVGNNVKSALIFCSIHKNCSITLMARQLQVKNCLDQLVVYFNQVHVYDPRSFRSADNAQSIVRMRTSESYSNNILMPIFEIDTCTHSLKNC